MEELLKRIGGAQKQTKIVEFPVDYFTPLISNFTQMDNNLGRIDIYLVEEFLFRLEKFARLPKKRLKVYDDFTICVLEIQDETGQVKHTPIDGLKPRQRELLAFLIRKGEASLDEMLDGVWRSPDKSLNVVRSTICTLDNFLHKKQYGFSIVRNDRGKYQIQFVD
ncbi:MAG: hypothetical protein IJQ31_14120 [Thermoguttaceae bacterium]|nr:hypothetical protein [Thermoguttaceae bacterium]